MSISFVGGTNRRLSEGPDAAARATRAASQSQGIVRDARARGLLDPAACGWFRPHWRVGLVGMHQIRGWIAARFPLSATSLATQVLTAWKDTGSLVRDSSSVTIFALLYKDSTNCSENFGVPGEIRRSPTGFPHVGAPSSSTAPVVHVARSSVRESLVSEAVVSGPPVRAPGPGSFVPDRPSGASVVPPPASSGSAPPARPIHPSRGAES